MLKNRWERVGIALLVLGVALIIIGPVIYAVVRDKLHSTIEDKIVVDEYGHEDYQDWKRDGDENDPKYYRRYYFYNITNLAEVQNGGVPILEQVGPYPYQRIREKIDVVFGDDGNYVEYKVYEHFNFLEEEANGRSINDTIIVANPTYFGILASAGNENNLRAAFFSGFLGTTLASLQNNFITQQYLPQVVPQTILGVLNANRTVFVQGWLTGQSTQITPTPIPYALPVSLAAEVPAATAAALFDPFTPYTVVQPTTFRLWQQALVNPSVSQVLQQRWGISAYAVSVIGNWSLNWETNLSPAIFASSYGISSAGTNLTRDLAYLQWGSLAILQNASVFTINSSLGFFPEFAGWARYVANNGATFDLATTTRIFDPTIGFRNVTIWGGFLRLLATGATDFSAFGLTPTQAGLIYQYSQYVLSNTINPAAGAGGLYVTRTVNDFLWGRNQPLLRLLDPTNPGSSLVRNYTSVDDARANSGIESVFTGKNNIDEVEKYRLFDGADQISIWAEPEYFAGGDGAQRAPRYDRDDTYSFYSDTLRRNVPFVYDKEVKVEDIKLDRFYLDPAALANQETDPAQAKYYAGISGTVNLTSLPVSGRTGLPIFLSKARFLDVDPGWALRVLMRTADGAVEPGLMPNQEEHDTYVSVNHLSGATMDFRKRIQFNLLLDNSRFGVFSNSTATPYLMPVYWAEEASTITDSQAEDFRDSAVRADRAAVIVVAVITPIGGVLFIIGIILLALGLMKGKDGKSSA